MPLLEVRPNSKRVRKWAGGVYAYDATQRRYRPVTGLARRRGILGKLKALWRRIKAEEGIQ